MSQITVIKSNKVKAPKGYMVVELAYKTEDGKTKGMKIFPFGDQKEVHEVASAAKPGEVLNAQFRQNEKGFWEFGSLSSTGEVRAVAAEAASSAAGSTKGNWETADERAAKQALISRQAVLNTAVAYFEAAKAKPSKEEVVEVAKFFLDFVNNKVQPTGDVE